MKILIVAMPSVHTKRWISQLKDSGIEVHWFDILNGGKMSGLDWVFQHTNWKLRFGNFKGRTFIKSNIPFLNKLLEKDVKKKFETILQEIKPDVVHSLVLYKCATPIFPIMRKYAHIKWVYSSWGSDLFYFRNEQKHLHEIRTILPYFHFMFSDCYRDKIIAEDLGFKGEFLGVFPGGGGFDIEKMNNFVKPVSERKLILLKGYQGRSGRALAVLKAIKGIKNELENFEIVVFGADPEIESAIQNDKTLKHIITKVYTKSNMLTHQEVLKLMGDSLVYIGNSESDGMPNTLLEAIIMGAFPIQSNPGGATEEIITHKKNGLLIEDVTNSEDIASLIKKSLTDINLLEDAFLINQKLKINFDIRRIKEQVLSCYLKIDQDV